MKKYLTMFVSVLLSAAMLTACSTGRPIYSDEVVYVPLEEADTSPTSDGDYSADDPDISDVSTASSSKGSSSKKGSSSSKNSSSSKSSSSNKSSTTTGDSSSSKSSSTQGGSSTGNTVDSNGDVIVQLLSKNDNKGTYEDFYIYIRTSDPSGQYYIRYNFIYEYNTEVLNTVNSTANIDAFRVKEAYLTKVTSITSTSVTRTDICQVLQQGEISLAVQEKNTNDFLGGYHGDDHMTEFKLTVGGKEYTPGEKSEVITCNSVKIHQVDILNRCGVANDNVIKHTQEYTIDGDGVKTNKKVEWLTSDFALATAYMQMFTMYRTVSGKAVCEKVATYDGNGNLLGSETTPISASADEDILSNTNIREVRYSSATSGISAKVGFSIVNNSTTVKKAFIQVRAGQGDNKWYLACKPNSGSKPAAGDVWEMNTYFDIDYTAP